MLDEKRLINLLKNKSESAFVELYNNYSKALFGICLRYSKEKTDAEDILQESFIRIFQNIESFNNIGSFEGWLKKIVVNVSINYYRKKVKSIIEFTDEEKFENAVDTNVFSELTSKEILQLVQSLPEGYRIIFNLFAIEGYKHNEIAEMLQITESTSKTQFMKAKKALINKVFKFYPNLENANLKESKTLIFDF
jgi:RNA polymerase sigma-70 factor (ECF subfamily)